MGTRLAIRSGWALLLVLVVGLSASAEVRLPGLFGDHMVFQRGLPVPVWGWADAGEQVTVTWDDQTHTAVADDQGRWSVKLDAMPAGGPHTVRVAGSNAIELADVLVGEVWVASGQSNMQWTVAASANPEAEQAAAEFPRIRMFTVDRVTAEAPQETCGGAWQVCSPETVSSFSAVAYYFGRALHQELDVPVGLINTSWGGTPIEAWTSLAVQESLPGLEPHLTQWQQQVEAFDPAAARAQFERQLAEWEEAAAAAHAAGREAPRKPTPPTDPRTSPHRPASLYNGMVAPLAPYAIRGGIWYQGESNAGRAHLYAMQLRAMIENWRELWGQGDFPFAWVQLANFMAPQEQPSEGGWAWIREQMVRALDVPNTGMAVIIDIGEADDIHPRNKQDVGGRLALWALSQVYGQEGIVYSGPLYRSMRRAGNAIELEFDHAEGLTAQGEELTGFAIAGADRQFVWADARIEDGKVIVSSPEVAEPVAVRYGWANNPPCNLYNAAGLPASPFRTDDWED